MIEIAFAIYTIGKYKLTPVTRPAVAILICLAIFQFAEYNVCETLWKLDGIMWARIGFVAITLLPPLGLQLAMRLSGRENRLLMNGSYIGALMFGSIFLFVGQGIQSQACAGNYVLFSIASWAFVPYCLYYYGLSILGAGYAWVAGQNTKRSNQKKALYGFAVGYLGFLLPTTTANILIPETRAAIPSVMCGFAVILAIVLATFVIPRYYKKK